MSRRIRTPGALLLALVVAQWGAGAAAAQTTTTGAPASTVASTTTTVPRPTTTAPASHPTTTAPVAKSAPAPSTSSSVPNTTSTTTTVPPASVDPASAAAYVDSLARSGANNTGPLLDALRALETLGFPHDEAVKVGFGHFPVGGYASFRDDFGDFRAGPPVHTHQGNDIFAAFDTPVRAPFDGVVRFASDPLGGQAAYLTVPDGTYFYIAHLNAYAPDVPSGSSVTQGRVIGLVGDTGDAKGGSPHAHFEIHPQGGAAVNPKPFLDAWLAEALSAVPSLVGGLVVDQPVVLQSTGLTRRFDLHELDRRAQAPVEPLLWASSVSPTGSALRLAEAQAARLLGGIDWEALAGRAAALTEQRRQAEETARLRVQPLIPPVLAAAVDAPRG